ncbi:MBL fold metallo-hydrolase [Chloroflexota bacterium]
MGVDMSSIDRIVLSHGHAEHTGGPRNVLARRKVAEIIAHPNVWTSKYTRRDGQAQEQYIGIPYSPEELESQGARFNLTKEPVRISEHIMNKSVKGTQTEKNLLMAFAGKSQVEKY